MEMVPGNGGNWFMSNGGGGGSPSADVGEFELLRSWEFSDGENIPRGGNRGFIDPWFHGCGVVPVPSGNEFPPLGGGQKAPVGVNDWRF